jgi:hypothetical protein
LKIRERIAREKRERKMKPQINADKRRFLKDKSGLIYPYFICVHLAAKRALSAVNSLSYFSGFSRVSRAK